MLETTEEPGSQGARGANLDPEDAPVELDEDGFLVSRGHRRQFPTDLDAWVRWAGAVVVGVAAFETLAYLISATLQGWATGVSDVPIPRPDGYYSLLLLAGVLLLVLRRGPGSGAASSRWVRGAACLAAGTGGALVVAQLSGGIGAIVQRSGLAFGEPAADVAGNVIGGIGGFADAVMAALAATLAVLLYRWSRTASGRTVEDGRQGMAEGGGDSGSAGEGEPEDGVETSGIPAAPDWVPWGSVGPAVASLLIGAAVAGACLVAFAVGTRSEVNDYLGVPPATGAPAVSVPSPAGTITLLPANIQPGSTYECSSPPASGAIVCFWALPIEPAAPSPSS